MLTAELPPPAIEEPGRTGGGYVPTVGLEQLPQPQTLPQVDLVVEVVGNLPLQAKVDDVTRLLGRRASAVSFNRSYPPTILELITLITRNPEKPRDRGWDSIMALTLRYDEATRRFLEVLRLVPRHYPSWGNLGAAYLALDRTDEAVHCLNRALELNPNYPLARENLALIEHR